MDAKRGLAAGQVPTAKDGRGRPFASALPEAEYRAWLARALADLPRASAPVEMAKAVLDQAGAAAVAAVRQRHLSEVHCHVLPTPLGDLCLAYSDLGIVRARLGATATTFAAEVAAALDIQLVADEVPPTRVARLVADFFSGKRLPLEAFDLATEKEFERGVLAAALAIPWGEVRSYAWLAREVGQPGAARAVGQALGRNPVPVLIPCHRAVRSDGGLGGYAFGLELKQRLLALEGVDLSDLERQARAGVRYLGSRTTGVYCLPTCRHARRVATANLVTFRSASEAEAAGFRACRVCRP